MQDQMVDKLVPDGKEPFKSRVRIEIQMNGYVFIFGVPVMLTFIILGSMLVLYSVGGIRASGNTQPNQQQVVHNSNTDELVTKVMDRLPEFAKALEPKVTVNVPSAPV